jgi:hypothetical protein
MIDFDGPVCDIFSGLPNHLVADELRAAGISVPDDVAQAWDPLVVFRAVADLGDQPAILAQELLTGLEVRAAQVARPAPGSAELIITAAKTGRSVTVVTNNSGASWASTWSSTTWPSTSPRSSAGTPPIRR